MGERGEGRVAGERGWAVIPQTPHKDYSQVVLCMAPLSYGAANFEKRLNEQFETWRNEGEKFECTDAPGTYEMSNKYCARVVFYRSEI